MKSTWFSDRQRYDFGRLLKDADYSMQHWDTFRCFLEAASGSFRQAVHKFTTGEMDDDIEQSVIRAQKQVKHPGKLANAMAVLTMALEKEPHDFLGKFLMEAGLNDAKWRGQCFTPQSISNLMAEMTLVGVEPDPNRAILLSEPACGGGSMVIATTEVLKRNGFKPRDFCWHATDVDWRCWAMCYIQCTLLGIPAGVIHGNALTLEITDSAWTFAAVMFPPKRKHVHTDLTPAVRLTDTDLTPPHEFQFAEQPVNLMERQLSLF